MPIVPSSIIEPVWDQFSSLLPPHHDTHPLGRHHPPTSTATSSALLARSLMVISG